MYNNVAKFDDMYLAKAQSLPSNDTKDGNGGAFDFSGTQNSFEIIVVVNEAVTISNTKALTIKLQDSADGTTYADLVTLYTKTATEDTTIAAGTELGRYALRSVAKQYLKAVIVTTAATAGKVDVYPKFIAR